VVIGSAALECPDEVAAWIAHFGAQRLCLAFDVRARAGADPRVHTHGWRQASGLSVWEALGRYRGGSIRHVLCTDIGRDGALTGPNLDLYRTALARFPDLAWQASGGVRDAADLAELALIGVAAAVSVGHCWNNASAMRSYGHSCPPHHPVPSTYATARS